MSKRKTTLLEWILRFLIVVLFCVALLVGFVRLSEWNELEKEKEELEKEKTELQEEQK